MFSNVIQKSSVNEPISEPPFSNSCSLIELITSSNHFNLIFKLFKETDLTLINFFYLYLLGLNVIVFLSRFITRTPRRCYTLTLTLTTQVLYLFLSQVLFQYFIYLWCGRVSTVLCFTYVRSTRLVCTVTFLFRL